MPGVPESQTQTRLLPHIQLMGPKVRESVIRISCTLASGI